jgi:5-methyltetrahydrofolate--homocysteine methyltransferase
MSGLLERLAAGTPLVSDGAMGTLLMDAGLKQGACPDAFSLTDPTALSKISGTYADAGADLVHTNTFGASPLKLAEYGLDHRTEDINRASVEAARAGVGPATLVSASVGPSGRVLEPYGDTSEAAVYESFHRQATALVEAGVDAITVETMIDLREAVLAVRAARAAGPAVPVLASMTFQETPRGFYTVMGTSVRDAAAGLLEAGADAVGSNCGNGIELMVLIARAFREATDRPLLIQANAGVPHVQDGVVRYPETPEDFAAAVPALVAAGVSVVGGCCGSDPSHIRALSGALKQGKSNVRP